MRRISTGLVSAMLILLSPVLQTAAGAEINTGSAENTFVGKINGLRASKGLAALAVHGELVDIGRRWAGVMADADRIYHNPNLANEVTADWRKLGENVGVGGSVDSLHDAFVASPAHYKNLVDPDFTHIGVGVVVGRDGVLFTSHQFMKLSGRAAPAGSTSPPAAEPAPSAPAPRATAAPTTRPARPAATAAPRPAPANRTPRAAAPVPTPGSVPASTQAVPDPEPEPAAPAAPAPRVVLVLDLLRALESVR